MRPLIPGQIEGKCAAVEVDYIICLLPEHLFKSHFIALNRMVAVNQHGSLIFKKCQSEARICTSLKTAEKKPLTIFIWQHLLENFYDFSPKMSSKWQEHFLKILCYSNSPNWGNIKKIFHSTATHFISSWTHIHSHTVE